MEVSNIENSLRMVAIKTCLESILVSDPESRSRLIDEIRLQSDLDYLNYSRKLIWINMEDLKAEIFPRDTREVRTYIACTCQFIFTFVNNLENKLFLLKFFWCIVENFLII